jgi:heat shock protein HslJ
MMVIFLRNIVFTLLLMGMISGCGDSEVGPNDKTNGLNLINYENPKVGQKSVYVKFMGFRVMEKDKKPIHYGGDTITLEIVEKLDDNSFIVSETTKSVGIKPADLSFILTVKGDTITFGKNGGIGSQLFNLEYTELVINQPQELNSDGWIIGSFDNTNIENGYLSNYSVGDSTFNRLSASTNYGPMSRDDLGTSAAYDSELGIIRAYSVNPWLSSVTGYDLLELKDTENQRTDFVDTKWELVSATRRDGEINYYEEKYASFYNIYFLNDKWFFLNYGNESGGSYSIDGDKIEIEMGSSTAAGGGFQGLYDILDDAYSYRATTRTLTIYSEHPEYSSVEFKRVPPNSPRLAITNHKWKLDKLELSDKSIVSVEDYIGDKDTDLEYIVNFSPQQTITGYSGCNEIIGYYWYYENKSFRVLCDNMTDNDCPFSYKFQEVMDATKSFDYSEGSLNIKTDHDEVKSLNFVPTR